MITININALNMLIIRPNNYKLLKKTSISYLEETPILI